MSRRLVAHLAQGARAYATLSCASPTLRPSAFLLRSYSNAPAFSTVRPADPVDSSSSSQEKKLMSQADDEIAKKRKLIEMECYMLQEMGEPAPTVIPESK